MIKTSKSQILPIAMGLLAILVAVPATISFSQQPTTPSDNATTTSNATATNQTQTSTNQTQPSTNQTGANQTSAAINQTRAQLEEKLANSLRENLTSGAAKVYVITMSRQPDVPVQQEKRDSDPLGMIEFQDESTMSIAAPEYASGENTTASLYKGGQMSFEFDNTKIAPDDIDVLFISTNGTDVRSPEVIDDAGPDNEFVIPHGLKDGGTYYVLVTTHWPDLHQDVMMGISGKVVNLDRP